MTSRILSKTLTISAAAGLLLATAGPARAQSNIWERVPAAYANDDYRTSYADAQRAAHENGYRDGLKRGADALRSGHALDIERERDYRNAEHGYNRSLGDRNRYRDTYRGGFAQGYRDGYGRRGVDRPSFPASRGWGGTANYGAYQNGTADGYKKGLDDVHDRKRADVERQKWYRSGDHDYDSRYGSKETYRMEYRRGFEEGYRRAYREARR